MKLTTSGLNRLDRIHVATITYSKRLSPRVVAKTD
jgi:hypothetical protein